jgi:vacuolar protein sorting-associated protein 13A/C
MALTINRLGMSLIRMGKDTESVRFLDDIDLTFSLDSRMSSSELMTSMEIAAKPIVLRASYRDINLIMAIVNKAFERYANSQKSDSTPEQGAETTSFTTKSSTGRHAKSSVSKSPRPIGRARVLTSKEQVLASL